NPAFVNNSLPATLTLKKKTSSAVLGPFSVIDVASNKPIGTTPKTLTITAAATSTNPTLQSQLIVTLGGTGSTNRTVTVTSTGTATGTATVTVRVTDTQCSSAPGSNTFPPTGCTAGFATYNIT